MDENLIKYVALAMGLGVIVIYNLKKGRKSKMQALEKIKKGALIVDVRSPAEFQGQHVPKAINIPVQELAQSMGKLGSDKSKPMVVYCASGGRSARAAQILLAEGFQDVTDAGGIGNLL